MLSKDNELSSKQHFKTNIPDLTKPNFEILPISKSQAKDIYKTPKRR